MQREQANGKDARGRSIMGNPDLIIIINGLAYLVDGREYADTKQAVIIALGLFTGRVNMLKSKADFPEDVEDEIRKIIVHEFINDN